MSHGYPPNFSPEEFYCKCGRYCDGPSAYPDRTRHLAWVLQQVRDEIAAPIKINSGYRCKKYNEEIGGAEHSYHVRGMAADLHCAAVSPEELADTIEEMMEHGQIPNGGLGRYNTFTHIDIRHKKGRWSG
jgi:uncharacterized protein YcbK (DUF882 family)